MDFLSLRLCVFALENSFFLDVDRRERSRPSVELQGFLPLEHVEEVLSHQLPPPSFEKRKRGKLRVVVGRGQGLEIPAGREHGGRDLRLSCARVEPSLEKSGRRLHLVR